MSPLLDLPAVDGVEITTIIDNSLDVTLASTSVARRLPLQSDLFTREQLRVEYGTSLLITVIDQGKRATLLFDVGLTPDGALRNIELLGIDLRAIQAIVLSHGHIDHTGGMLGLLEKLGRRRLPILLHPDAFLKRRMVIKETLAIDLPAPSLHDLHREGIELLVERGPSFLLNGTVLVTGQVERTTTFEEPFLHQAEIDGSWQPDPWVYDDQAIVIHVRNKGLVVITGCGHAGIMNILRQARSHSGVEPIYAVLGGFHLTAIRSEQIITQTVEALQQLNPAVIVPAHCTGWRATQRIVQTMPQVYTPNSVGTTFALMSQ